MRLGILFSGGKDSALAAYLAKEYDHKISCLLSVLSKNPDSYMFHTPTIEKVRQQAAVMKIPLLEVETAGEKEVELEDLKRLILEAKEKYAIEGVVTGAVESVYQATRVQRICNELGLEVFNPLWQKPQFELLNDLVENGFKTILTGIAAFPLDETWLGREIDKEFIEEMKKLQKEFSINPAGEGGEFESLVLDAPLFSSPLEIVEKKILGEGNACRMEVTLK